MRGKIRMRYPSLLGPGLPGDVAWIAETLDAKLLDPRQEGRAIHAHASGRSIRPANPTLA